jgi:hypothetical protein
MTYKETLFFIGKCLTINHEQHNKILVEEQLISENVDWESIVKVSTSHYVFPALYCNLKRANFLHYLPEELVNYMIHITDLNRERNLQIIEQAKEINELLLENNITPIFLKGTGNLLEGLYEDIAERMVGDIDFLVNKRKFKNTIEVLKKNGYKRNGKIKTDTTIINRHYPRLVKNRIGAIEIHYRMVKEPFQKHFNLNYIKDSLVKNDSIVTLSNENKILMTILNKQINDNGQLYKSLNLRNSYDLFILSKKTDALRTLIDFKKYFNPLNNFIAISNLIFNHPESLKFTNNKSARKFTYKSIYFIDNQEKYKNHIKKVGWYLNQKNRILKFVKSFYKIEYLNYSVSRIKERFLTKNPKPNS